MNMKRLIPVVALVASLAMSGYRLPAAEGADAASELKAVVTKIQTKLKEGKKTEAELAEELKEFDALIAKHKDEKTDDTAQMVFMKAVLYQEVFGDYTKAMELVEQVKRDYPETKQGKSADTIIESMKKQEQAAKIQKTLVAGAKFPDFEEKDLDGQPLSIAKYKGKVVLLDFWATWCGPCVGELPNVLKVYEKYQGKGFEIIGVSLDRDEAKLKSFIKEKKMTWPQYFDGKGWENKLSGRYGIRSIPATFLLDGEGKIIASNLRGESLEEAVSKAIAK